jgi:translation initiation factor 4A
MDTNFEQLEFDDLNLRESILKGIFSYGFERPSPIQCKAIPVLLEGNDVVAQSASGSGKSASFGLAILQITDPTCYFCQSIIISPTRELAEQTKDVIQGLGQYDGVTIHMSVGGTAVRDEIDKLRTEPPQIIAATPGRLLQMIERNYLDISKLKILVIDEADEMLKIGFRDQLIRIFHHVPKDSQVAIFSATMPKEAIDISKKFMRNPTHILVQAEQLTLEGIKQFYINVSHEDYKLETLLDIYSRISVAQAIIFCNSKRKVNILSEQLKAKGFTVSAMHSDMDVRERNEVYKSFKKGLSRILISTDVLARGIDVQSVSFVINYDIPRSKECYIHRIGRYGRYGRKGVAINFIVDEELKDIKAIESFYATEIHEMPIGFEEYIM